MQKYDLALVALSVLVSLFTAVTQNQSDGLGSLLKDEAFLPLQPYDISSGARQTFTFSSVWSENFLHHFECVWSQPSLTVFTKVMEKS